MQRTTWSAAIVIVATIITTGYSREAIVANAAAPVRLAQAKAATPSPAEACSLLTKEDAAAALGEAVTGPESSSGRSIMPGTTASSCEYSGSGLHRVHLNFWRASADTTAQFRQTLQVVCAQKGKEGLSGLGDVACWYSEKHEELQVLKGAAFFSVELRKSGDPTEAIKGVAKRVSDRLR